MRAVTPPSRRERGTPPPVCSKIEQVFTPTTIHHRRTAHPGYHAAHTAMATRQHQATGSAHEHRGPTTRAARPGIQDLDTNSPEIRRYPNQQHERKGPVFRIPGLPPVSRPNRSTKTGLHRPVQRHRTRDELSPAAGREMSMVLLPGARRARSCCRVRDKVSPAAGRETSSVLLPGETSDGPQLGEGQPSTKIVDERPRRRIEGRHKPHTDGPTLKKSSRRRERLRPLPGATTSSEGGEDHGSPPSHRHHHLPLQGGRPRPKPPTARAVTGPSKQARGHPPAWTHTNHRRRHASSSARRRPWRSQTSMTQAACCPRHASGHQSQIRRIWTGPSRALPPEKPRRSRRAS